jgi:type I restriction enzyme S subunit
MTQIKSLRTGIKFKDTPIGKIPVDWEVTRLGDVVTAFYNGGTPDTKKKEYWDGVIPWITGADFINQKVGQIRRFITPEGVKNSATNIVPKGNLLVVTRTGVGKLAITPFDIAISQDISGVIPDNKKTVSEFLFWNLNYNDKNLKTLRQGTSINGILREDLSSFLISLPPLPEQKKIADILTTVDDAIEETGRIIEKTKELKKGLMQKLLTRGIGHKKFKKMEIGEIPVEWDVNRLVDLCKGKPEYGANISAADKDDHLPRYVRITDVTEDGYLLDDSWQSIDRKAAEPYILGEGDFLFARSGATVGKTYLYRKEDGECAFAGYMIRFRPDYSKLLPEFLFQFAHSEIYYNWVKGMLRSGAQPNINGTEYAGLIIPKPPINEQNKIVNILSSMDEEIRNETKHNQNLETLKKSLMQVLLTGRVRVKLQ